MAKVKVKVYSHSTANGNAATKSAGMAMPKGEKKKAFIYHSTQKVVSSPEGIKTWSDAINKVMRNYSEAWERLAKR